MVCDDAGRFFLAGTADVAEPSRPVADWKTRVWCCDAAGELNWMLNEDLRLGTSVGLAVGRDGGPLLAWSDARSTGERSNVVRIDPADGRVLGAFEASESEGSHAPDLRHAETLDVDVDGSVLALVAGQLHRLSPQGQSIRRWPRPPLAWDVATFGMLGAPRFRTFGRSEVPDDYMQFLPEGRYSQLGIGWDGDLYIVAPCTNLVLLHRIDRRGRVVYSIELPDRFEARWPPRADRQGRVVLGQRTSVLRVSADGSEVQTLVERSGSGPGIEGVAVAADGEVTLAIESEGGGLVRVEPDRGEQRQATKPLPDRRRVAVPVLIGLLAFALARVAALMFSTMPALEHTVQSGGELEGYPLIGGRVPRIDAEGAARWLDLMPLALTLEGVAASLLLLALVVSSRHPRQGLLQALPAILIAQPIVLVLVPLLGLQLFSLYNFYLATQILAFFPPFLWATGFILANRSPTKTS